MRKKGWMLLALACVHCGPLHAAREPFGDGKYSLEFPDGWAKPDGGDAKALIVRQNADGSALFAVNRMPLPANARADLDATAKTIAEAYKKDLKLAEVPAAKEGEIDGLPARFLTVAGDPKTGGEAAALALFLVLVEAKGEVVVMQATLSLPAAKETREACLTIIKSFQHKR